MGDWDFYQRVIAETVRASLGEEDEKRRKRVREKWTEKLASRLRGAEGGSQLPTAADLLERMMKGGSRE